MSTPTMDPTFYRSAADAAAAPAEELAYVVAFDRNAQRHDAMCVVDVNPGLGNVRSGRRLDRHAGRGQRAAPLRLERLQQCAQARGPRHERRRPPLPAGPRAALVEHPRPRHPAQPRTPHVVRTISSKELSAKAGYSRPHTMHCGPDGVSDLHRRARGRRPWPGRSTGMPVVNTVVRTG